MKTIQLTYGERSVLITACKLELLGWSKMVLSTEGARKLREQKMVDLKSVLKKLK